jgi:hypothetical protein
MRLRGDRRIAIVWRCFKELSLGKSGIYKASHTTGTVMPRRFDRLPDQEVKQGAVLADNYRGEYMYNTKPLLSVGLHESDVIEMVHH